jgi:hypothetical protein
MDDGATDPEAALLRNSTIARFLLMCVHGFLVWMAVPLATLAWLLAFQWRKAPLGQFIGWVDLNLVAGLQRTVLRPITRAPVNWVPYCDLSGVTHRIHPLDPM